MRTEFHNCLFSAILLLIKTDFLRFLLRMESHYEWLKIYESMSVNGHGITVVTGRAHCQRHVAFFFVV